MKVLILGAGISGRAAARLLTRSGTDFEVYEDSPESTNRTDPTVPDYPLLAGPWRSAMLNGIDLVITSPGFSPRSAPIKAAERAGIPVWSEVEFAIRRLDCPLIAVTGTNGKTTVVEQATRMLQESGLKAVGAGNIGRAVSDIVTEDWDVVVLEVSSFQLTYTYSLAPDAAVIVNIAADHLDWHGSEDAYRTAKARIFENFTEDNLLVYDAGDPGAVRAVAGASGRKAPVTGSIDLPSGVFGFDRDKLVLPAGTVPLPEAPTEDPAYRINLAAAAVAAGEMGAGHRAIARTVGSFVYGNHRRQVVGEWGGVTWINDSKATNPHAALKAVDRYPSVVLIAGGRNKGLDLGDLIAHPHLRALIAIGESGPDLIRQGPSCPSILADSMPRAVTLASDMAVAGDTVLLSPGCASFDMFSSYEERGESFSRLVRRRLDIFAAGESDGDGRP